MLVVTIIIAAVVAMSASGMISSAKSTTTGAFDVKITDESLMIKNIIGQ
ncbi:hypothetical protein [uncultured Methanocorpusculum sp.]|nr:hypothetical protein [uncultured Methanocorpusculum sp.]